ncbi:MAG: HAD family phosphatase [Lachnospiraceae bacterium]|nr:HAD family phosphatase [Lachnospiraceae bacterium]
MADRSLFLSDLDETLLTRDKRITERTRKALDDFAERGGVFAISTGRPLMSAEEVCRTMELDYPGSYIVSFNGALITEAHGGGEVYRAGIAIDDAFEIMDMADRRGIYIQAYRGPYILAKEYNEHSAHYISFIHCPLIIFRDIKKEMTEPPCKLLAIDADREKLTALRDEIAEKLGDRTKMAFSSRSYLEIFSKEAGKGRALRYLAKYLGIPEERTYAAGDMENDMEMIEMAGTGIAMINGADKIKAAADVVTEEDNNHDGLAKYIDAM